MANNTEDVELRKSVHMAMLGRSTNAKSAGNSTVVMLGFAVDVALGLIQQEANRQKDELLDSIELSIRAGLSVAGDNIDYAWQNTTSVLEAERKKIEGERIV